MTTNPPKTVLILCTGNSCRSQMAEAIWNDLGEGQWHAQSAGSRPAGYVHELALQALQELGLPIDSLESKSSSQFENTPFDLVVTVCDNARDACPVWPAADQLLHWPFPDPAYAEGSNEDKMAMFREVRDQIKQKIQAYLNEVGKDG